MIVLAFGLLLLAFAIGYAAIQVFVRHVEEPLGPGERGTLPDVPYGEERLPL